MKDIFLNLILEFIKVYPQCNNKKINYTFSGSISYNLLSCISGHTIYMYSFNDFKLNAVLNIMTDSSIRHRQY